MTLNHQQCQYQNPSTGTLLPPTVIKPRFSVSTSDVQVPPVDFIQQLEDYLAMFQGDEQQKLKNRDDMFGGRCSSVCTGFLGFVFNL
jgi:hypothetical protein